MEPQLKPGDIVFTRGAGPISRMVRAFTRTFGEPRTKVNHVGVIVAVATPPLASGTARPFRGVEGGPVETAILVEALSTVKRHGLTERYGKRTDRVAVYRPTNLTPKEVRTIVAAAEAYVGRKYGYGKIALHFLDWMLLGAYAFRRLGRMEDYPICSWLVASAYAKAGKDFGVAAGAASPDDIWDFCVANAGTYEPVRPLARLVPGPRASPAPQPTPATAPLPAKK